MALKLYGHDPSPFVRRVLVLLQELGLPYERDTHGWLDPVDTFTASSPIKRLPMLDRGPDAKVRFVYESRVIAGVLYDMPGTRPAADLQRTLYAPELDAADHNVLSVADSALDAAVSLFLFEKDGIKPDQSSCLQRQATRVGECLDWLNAIYTGKTTLTPGTLAYVDICIVSMIGWLRFRSRADVTRWPNLVAVESATAARPSFATTAPR